MLVLPFSLLRRKQATPASSAVVVLVAGWAASGIISPSENVAYYWGTYKGAQGTADAAALNPTPLPYSGSLLVSGYALNKRNYGTISDDELTATAAAIEFGTGKLWTWGTYDYGMLGDNTNAADRALPATAAGTRSYTKVTGTKYTFAAIAGDTGAIYAWGRNNLGQVGDNTTTNRSSPTSVVGGRSYIDVSGGTDHFASLDSSGYAYCWGYGVSGGLGDNSAVSSSSPVSVVGGIQFSSIAAGSAYNIGVRKSDGALYAWGINASGQLGDNTNSSRSSPVSVVGGKSYSRVACGASHSLGIEASTGFAWAWGLGTAGRLGEGSLSGSKSSPTSVIGGRSYNEIAAGLNHSLAYEKSTGIVWVWGSNSFGQIGIPSAFSEPNSSVTASAKNIAISINNDYYIENSTGVIYGSGIDSNGSLGRNAPGSFITPASVVGGRSYSAVGVGTNYYSNTSSSAWGLVASSGFCYGWGDNSYGQLGDGTTLSRSSPTSVIGARSYSKVSSGDAFTIFIEGSTGRGYSTGYNNSGTLGINNITNQLSPTSIVGARSYRDVSAGFDHTLFIEASTGRAHTCGSNSYGELGINSTTRRSSPTSVAGARSFSAVSAGSYFSLALEGSTGRAYAWGSGSDGKLGDGTTTSKSSPVSVSGGRSYSRIATGSNHAMAIEATTGNVYSWGLNSSGQLGDGTTTSKSSPISVVGGRSFKFISASGTRSMGYEESTGIIYTWGDRVLAPTQSTSPISMSRVFL